MSKTMKSRIGIIGVVLIILIAVSCFVATPVDAAGKSYDLFDLIKNNSKEDVVILNGGDNITLPAKEFKYTGELPPGTMYISFRYVQKDSGESFPGNIDVKIDFREFILKNPDIQNLNEKDPVILHTLSNKSDKWKFADIDGGLDDNEILNVVYVFEEVVEDEPIAPNNDKDPVEPKTADGDFPVAYAVLAMLSVLGVAAVFRRKGFSS